ncbi:DNA translocase FtsK [Rubellimicrobium rubrum]|uniref:DNA translocase FtsK n=1 Tax=Rubellimicrobium rubrum TaxID=2585369 RepID=A0A5C4MXK8_9RHOB|nr:DNA translocase FtsK [Rubellimicrobium rubrum]TNC49803.1 DNA translocase FtsK [Rubellimicrobium rubrum]
MAYQTRDRAPLLDSQTQASLEKRGKELVGLSLIAVGLLATMMLASYSPEDPNWLLASDAPTQNWLGRFGASIAHPLMMIVGRASWGIPLVLCTWGLRLATHRAEERARTVFAPIFIAVLAAAFATLPPGEGWTQSYGPGGLFGDTALGFLLTVVPLGSLLVSLLVAAITAALGLFVLGVTGAEIRVARQRTALGLVLAYAWALRTAARGLLLALDAYEIALHRIRDMMAERAARIAAEQARHEEEQQAIRALPEPAPHVMPGSPRTTAIMRPQPGSASHSARSRNMPPPFGVTDADPEDEDGLEPEDFHDDSFWHEPASTRPAIPPAPAFLSTPAPDHAPTPAAMALSLAPSFLGNLLRRARGEAEPATTPEDEHRGERIKARIGDAIRARKQTAPAADIIEHDFEEPIPVARRIAPAAAQRPEPVVPAAPRRGEVPARAAATPAPVMRVTVPEPETLDEGGEEDLPEIAPVPARQAPIPRMAAPAPKPVPKAPAAMTYAPPPMDLLTDPADIQRHHLPDESLSENARALEQVLDDFGVKGEITSVRPGPVVTMYELEPAPGLKASRVIGLADDIARNMSALSARVSTVPGRNVIGIELPNEKREKVVLREILAAHAFDDVQMRLPLALGKDIGGEPIVANLAKMPHLLIAGTTGSGKSVAINTMILSLLYKLTPEECRLIMIDPKMLELSVYDGIPHLLSPVVTDPKKAVVALKWVVGEMEERYRKMSKMGVRNIEGYNGRVRDALERGEMFSRTVQTGFDDDTGDPVFETDEFMPEILPFIVVIVDEMADLMMVAGKEIEACIQRLAQMARASGIHLIMATQRPSVDVITGTIKANFPTRISFQVTSKIDSRTILGEQGAEQLLGQGDMLYMAGGGRITRIHGPFCSDEEVEEIVTYLKAYGPPDYVGSVLEEPPEDGESSGTTLPTGNETEDALYDMAVQIVARDRKCSTSYIQRKLAIGYNKAARLVEQMEEEGVVTPANHVGKREILVPEAH